MFSASHMRFRPTLSNRGDYSCITGKVGSRGPILDVEIRLHPAELERYRLEERTAPLPFSASAIIDTAAQTTCILASTAANLRLNPVGRARVSGASGRAESDVYSLSLQLGVTLERLPNPIEVFAHALPEILGAQLLIGLDVLRIATLTVHGPDSRFELLLP